MRLATQEEIEESPCEYCSSVIMTDGLDCPNYGVGNAYLEILGKGLEEGVYFGACEDRLVVLSSDESKRGRLVEALEKAKI